MKNEQISRIVSKIIFLFFSLMMTTGFAENIVLMNRTSYPAKNQKSKIAIQWATSAKEMDEANAALLHGFQSNSNSLQFLNRSGKLNLNIPNDAEYFRVLIWSKDQEDPDLHTNWVNIVPNKTYELKMDHLVPTVLISGFGC